MPTSGFDAPPDLRQFLDAVPDAETIRSRLSQNRREAAFLRRFLKLALDAERARNTQRQEVAHAR